MKVLIGKKNIEIGLGFCQVSGVRGGSPDSELTQCAFGRYFRRMQKLILALVVSLIPSASFAAVNPCCTAGKNTIFSIVDAQAWTTAKKAGSFQGERFAKTGYVDAQGSTAQVEYVANKYWKGKTGVQVLCIDKSKVKPEIKMETSSSGTYPHIYGALNADAVTQAVDLAAKADGTYAAPAAISCI